jgi:hypothetical protein
MTATNAIPIQRRILVVSLRIMISRLTSKATWPYLFRQDEQPDIGGTIERQD